MKTTHRVGLVMWRGGLLLVAGYAAFDRLRAILSIADDQLELAVAVLLTGLLFVLLSVILEQIDDARTEKEAPK